MCDRLWTKRGRLWRGHERWLLEKTGKLQVYDLSDTIGVPPLARRDSEEIQVWAVRVKPDDPGEWEKSWRRLDVTGRTKSVTGMSYVVVSASQKRAVFPTSHCTHTKTRSQTISFPPLPSWEVILLKSHPACSLAATHAATDELPRSHTLKKIRHSTQSSSFDSVCPIIPHFFFPLPPSSTLWKPLLRETKSVISLVLLMHQTFLISGIEKRAAQR